MSATVTIVIDNSDEIQSRCENFDGLSDVDLWELVGRIENELLTREKKKNEAHEAMIRG